MILFYEWVYQAERLLARILIDCTASMIVCSAEWMRNTDPFVDTEYRFQYGDDQWRS